MSPDLELQNSTDKGSSQAEATTNEAPLAPKTKEDKQNIAPKVKSDIPKNLQDSKISKTTVVGFKKYIGDKLQQLEDLASMEVFMPTTSRMAIRMKSIKEEGSARTIKIQGHLKTTPPKMHITKLKALKINNDECKISFSVFETDKDGNKVCYEQNTEIIKENGDKINRVTSAEYRVAYEVTETIKTGKAIEREIVKMELQK